MGFIFLIYKFASDKPSLKGKVAGVSLTEGFIKPPPKGKLKKHLKWISKNAMKLHFDKSFDATFKEPQR